MSVEEGEFVTLLGPAARENHTRVIAGLEAGFRRGMDTRADVTSCPGKDRCLIFQSYALFPHMTVAGSYRIGPRIEE